MMAMPPEIQHRIQLIQLVSEFYLQLQFIERLGSRTCSDSEVRI